LIQAAASQPVRIWLLDAGEPVSTAALLDARSRDTRWLGGRVSLAECAGLTIPQGGEILMIAPWYRQAVLCHELGHALSVLLGRTERRRIEAAYAGSCQEGRSFVPLAAASVGEYVACGLAALTKPASRRQLATIEPELAYVLERLWQAPTKTGRGLASFGALATAAARLLAGKPHLTASPAQ
jgi:hypothetical protein